MCWGLQHVQRILYNQVKEVAAKCDKAVDSRCCCVDRESGQKIVCERTLNVLV